MKALHGIAFVLLVIGGLNWLLIGVGAGNVVAYLGSVVSTIVYILVGLSAIFLVATHKKDCRHCDSGPSSTGGSTMM